jgi:hypothetical protein
MFFVYIRKIRESHRRASIRQGRPPFEGIGPSPPIRERTGVGDGRSIAQTAAEADAAEGQKPARRIRQLNRTKRQSWATAGEEKTFHARAMNVPKRRSTKKRCPHGETSAESRGERRHASVCRSSSSASVNRSQEPGQLCSAKIAARQPHDFCSNALSLSRAQSKPRRKSSNRLERSEKSTSACLL